MSFRDGLIRARSHIAFILALLVAFPLILWLDQEGHGLSTSAAPRPPANTVDKLLAGERLPLAPPQPLRPDQLEWGRIAWRYFVLNTDPGTGLANSAAGYPSTTMWDSGSFLLGLVSAERIGLIDRGELDQRLAKALASLEKLPLFDGALPNKAYDTKTLQMVDYNNKPSEHGVGWSALDLGRMLVALAAVERLYPDHAVAARRVTARWDTTRLVRDGQMFGAALDASGQVALHQEGRLGYEEYAAKAFILGGLDAYQAWRTDDTGELVTVEGEEVPVDSRTPESHGAQVITTSEPYVLDGLEFGFDTRSRVLAQQVYRAQEKRWEKTGTPTAVSEGHLDRAPFFVYATVVGDGVPWAVLTDKGERHDELRSLSTKTAFGFDALFATPYSAKLVAAAVELNDPKAGWLEGRYEADGKPNTVETANTNGIMLESLAYRAFGPLLTQKAR